MEPSSGQFDHLTKQCDKWSVKELMNTMEQQKRTISVGDGQFAVHSIVELAGRQLCGEHDSFERHPSEGVTIG